MNLNELISISPEITLACGAMLLLIAGVYSSSDRKHLSLLFKLAIGLLVITGVILYEYVGTKPLTALNGLFISEYFSVFVKMIILGASALVLTTSIDIIKQREAISFEFPVLILLATTGMMVMVSANHLLSLYMGLEMQSLALYILAASNRNSEQSSEAGLKYFMLGALASGILLFGCSFIYGFAGTMSFPELADKYAPFTAPLPLGVLVGVILVITGLCFKVSAVPFHMWTPDVYEGAPKAVTAFLATAPKIAAMALFIRFAIQPFGAIVGEWQQIIIFTAAASMLVGAFGALRQTNIKRLMAYSSIGHVGYMLIGLAVGSDSGIFAMLLYLAIYASMNVGAFACIVLMRKNGHHVETIADLAGLGKSRPIYAAIFGILMLSMAGIPPLAGFLGKMYVLFAAIESELYILAFIGILSSLVAAFYYLRIIKVMYFDKTDDVIDSEISGEMKIVLGLTAVFNLLLFVYPLPLKQAAKLAADTLLL